MVYDELKNYNKEKRYLEKVLQRKPTREELGSITVKNVDYMESIEIDAEAEDEFELKYKLTVKNNNLEKSRLEKKLSQKDLARLVNIGAQSYCAIECCRSYPKDNVRDRISNVLNKNADYLFPSWLEIFSTKWKRAEREKIVKLKTTSLETEEALQIEAPNYFGNLTSKIVCKKIIDKAIHVVSKKERKILDMRFGLDDGIPHTLEETAYEFGVTSERIRQVEARAMEKMYNILPKNIL